MNVFLRNSIDMNNQLVSFTAPESTMPAKCHPAMVRRLTASLMLLLATLVWHLPAWSETGVGNVVLLNPGKKTNSVELHVILPLTGIPIEKVSLMHYLEHLVWAGVRADLEQHDYLHDNAWTSAIAVGYWLKGDQSELRHLLDALSRVFQPIDVDQQFAAEEKDIVRREYDYRIVNNIDGLASQATNRFLYQGNQLSASAIGDPDSIDSFSLEQAKVIHELTHLPERAVVVVVGDLSRRQLQSALKQSQFPYQKTWPAEFRADSFQLAELEQKTFEYTSDQVKPRLLWHRVVALDNPIEPHVLELLCGQLSGVLISNLPGGLAGPLRYDEFLAQHFRVYVGAIDNRHVEVVFSAHPDTGVSLEQLQQAFELTLSEAPDAMTEASYQRIVDRQEDSWPNWRDKSELRDWMVDYSIGQIRRLRQPLSVKKLKSLSAYSSYEQIKSLLIAINGEGRTAITHFTP